jgi:hypothetical protein
MIHSFSFEYLINEYRSSGQPGMSNPGRKEVNKALLIFLKRLAGLVVKGFRANHSEEKGE